MSADTNAVRKKMKQRLRSLAATENELLVELAAVRDEITATKNAIDNWNDGTGAILSGLLESGAIRFGLGARVIPRRSHAQGR